MIQLTTLFFSEAYSAFPPSNCQNTSDSLPSWTILNSAESEIRFSTSLAKCCSSPMLFFPTHKKLACALLSKKTSLVLRDCANGATYWLKQVLFSDAGHDLRMRSFFTAHGKLVARLSAIKCGGHYPLFFLSAEQQLLGKWGTFQSSNFLVKISMLFHATFFIFPQILRFPSP